jgi:YD repeat-containing protein
MRNPLRAVARFPRNTRVWLMGLTLLVGSAGAARAAVSLSLQPLPPPDPYSPPAFRLLSSPTLTPGERWLVEFRPSLSPTQTWQVFEPALVTSNQLNLELPALEGRESYFRLRAAGPELLRVEPAMAVASGGVELFVIGQRLGTNGLVRIGGQTLPVTTQQAGTLYRCVSPALTAGVYDVEWMEGGQVVARAPRALTVTGQPLPINQRLLEPPAEPPASPEWARKKVVKFKAGAELADKVNTGKRTAPSGAGSFKNDSGADDVAIADARRPGRCNFKNIILRAEGDDDEDNGLRLIPATGELQLQECDVVVPGVGLDFAFVRTYRSRTGRTTPLGHNWDHSYNLSIEAEGDDIAVCDGTGRRDVMFRQNDGTYSRDEFFWHGRWDGVTGNFILEFPGKGVWEFYHFGVHPAGGRIARIADANGNELQFTYDLSGRLSQVTDTLGRPYTLSYNTDGRLHQLADFSGRVWTYTYHTNGSPGGSAGDLASVTTPPVTNTPTGNDFPAGKTTRYTYSRGAADERLNHNLTSITDPKGQTWLQVTYHTNTSPAELDFDAVASVQRGGDRTDLRRGLVTASPGNRYAVVRAIVRDGVGNVCETFCDSLNRPVIVREFTGRSNTNSPVTATENRPTGKLRDADPDYYETAFEWNRDSLLTRYLWPDGDEVRCDYERDFDPAASPRKKGDLRVLRELSAAAGDLDEDGLLDISERVWRLEHDPRFGSPAPALRSGGNTTTRGGSVTMNSQTSSTRLAAADHTIKTKNAEGSFRVAAADHTIKTKNAEGSFRMAAADHTIKTKNAEGSFRLFCDAAPSKPLYDWHEDFRMGGPGSAAGSFGPQHGHFTRLTDPRGIITTATYDQRGNLLRVRATDPVSGVSQFDCDYDARGRLTRCIQPTDAEGRRRQDTFTYYTNGPMAGYLATARCDDGGLSLTTTFEYDARGNLTRCVDPRSNDTLWTYNALDQVVVCQSPPAGGGQRVTTRFLYDANDNLVQVDHENRDANGALEAVNPWWTSFAQFDALDRPVLLCHEVTHVVQQGAVFLTNRLSWDANDNLVRLEGPRAVSGEDPNQQTVFTYDERNLMFTTVAAPGTGLSATNRWDYNPKGQVQRVNKIEALTIKQKVVDNDRYGVRRITDPAGNVTLFSYDRAGNLVRIRHFGETNDVPGGTGNIRLAETRYEYDSLNRLVRHRQAFFDIFTQLPISDGENTTTFAYAPNGQLICETDDLGRTTRYTYDTAGRCVAITDPATNRVEFSYDANGNVTLIRQVDRSDLGGPEQVFFVSRTFDACDRLTGETDNVGNTTQFAYDSRDNLVRVTDPRTNASCYAYDGLGRLLSAQNYAGPCGGTLLSASQWEYRDTRLVQFSDGNSNVTHYAYDSLDRCVAVTNADHTVAQFAYDAFHNLAVSRDPNGTLVTNTCDLLDRCVRRDIVPGPGVAPDTTFEQFAYDGLSRLVLASNNVSRCTFAWDSLGNCRTATQNGFTVAQTHDTLGNLLTQTLPSTRMLAGAYDALNRPASLQLQAGGPPVTLATFAYEGPDRLGRVTRPNGINTRLNWNGTLSPPNQAGDFGWQQVVRVNHQVAGGGAVVDQRGYAYDRNQNKTLRAQLVPFTQGGSTQTNFWSSDALDRLVQSDTYRGNTLETTRTYQLDPNGNRQVVVENGSAQPYLMNPTLPEPADFQRNQYTVSPFGEYLYDANGNRTYTQTADGERLFTYDYADRLVRVERLSGGVPELLLTCTYDALGRCLTRTFHPEPPNAPQTTTYVYSPEDGSLVEEWRDGTLLKTVANHHIGGPASAAYAATGRIVILPNSQIHPKFRSWRVSFHALAAPI